MISVMAVSEAQQVGPTNITRREGETNEIIPCPLSTTGGLLPYWKISGVIYSVSQLKYPYMGSLSPLALQILYIDRTLNGTSYQCLVAPGLGDDPTPQQSSIGILTVDFNSSVTIGKN